MTGFRFFLRTCQNSINSVRPKPWLTNELDIEVDRLQEFLKATITEHLEATDILTFNLTALFGVDNVVGIVKQLLNKFGERSSEGKVCKI